MWLMRKFFTPSDCSTQVALVLPTARKNQAVAVVFTAVGTCTQCTGSAQAAGVNCV